MTKAIELGLKEAYLHKVNRIKYFHLKKNINHANMKFLIKVVKIILITLLRNFIKKKNDFF